MKRNLILLIALCVASLLLTQSLSAQIFNETLTLQNQVTSQAPYKALCEEPINDYLIVTTALLECPSGQTCNTTDVNMQVFDANGMVVFSYIIGIPGISETPYAVTLCPNFDDVIVVGGYEAPNGTALSFAMRVEINSGNVHWYQTYDAFLPATTRQRFQGIKEITNSVTGTEEYFLYGIAQGIAPASVQDKVHMVRIDANGINLSAPRLYEHPITQMDGDFDPTDMTINAKGNYIMVGTYTETNAAGVLDSDIFLLEMDQFGQLAPQMLLYDVNNGTGTTIQNRRPSITADPVSGTYLIAFDSENIIPGPPGAQSITSLQLQQTTNVPVAAPFVHWGTGYEDNRVSGVGLNPNNTEFLIGTIHAGPASGVFSQRQGLLRLTTSSIATGHVQYLPDNAVLLGYSMLVGTRGIYHEAGHLNSDTYQVLRTDYVGGGTAFNCNVTLQTNQQQESVNMRIIKMAWDNEPWLVSHNPNSTPLNGLIDFCDGTSSNFKKPAFSATDLEEEWQIYPTVFDATDLVTLELNTTEPGMRTLSISNLTGQVLYETELTVNVGNNTVELAASLFSSGMNLVQIKDPKNVTLETRKVVKQ